MRTEGSPVSDCLEVDRLVRRFGGVVALDGVTLRVPRGQTRALIGPNGSGKSTLINCVSGVDKRDEGDILVNGERVPSRRPAEAARMGIARTFQTLRLFDDLTVLENVMVAMHPRRGYGLARALSLTPRYRRSEAAMRLAAVGLLELVGIAADAGRAARTLSYGHRRLVEIARALATEPDLLLLDEPAAGMNDTETARLADLVKAIGARGTTMVVVEHNMDFVAAVASEVTVLDNGRKIAEGTPEQVRRDPAVLTAYLGTAEEVA